MPLIRLDRIRETAQPAEPAGRPAPGEQQAVEQPDGATAQHDDTRISGKSIFITRINLYTPQHFTLSHPQRLISSSR